MTDLPPTALSAALKVTTMLAEGRYFELEVLTSGTRLNAHALAQAVKHYGRSLLPPPSDTAARLNAVPVMASGPQSWSVQVPLATVEEGWSDLTLELTLTQAPDGTIAVEIDDLHVL